MVEDRIGPHLAHQIGQNRHSGLKEHLPIRVVPSFQAGGLGCLLGAQLLDLGVKRIGQHLKGGGRGDATLLRQVGFFGGKVRLDLAVFRRQSQTGRKGPRLHRLPVQ